MQKFFNAFTFTYTPVWTKKHTSIKMPAMRPAFILYTMVFILLLIYLKHLRFLNLNSGSDCLKSF